METFTAATARLTTSRRYAALVPTQLRRLLDAGAADTLRSYDAVLVGGAAAPDPLLAQARTEGVRIVTTYGSSETCGANVCSVRLGAEFSSSRCSAKCGRPFESIPQCQTCSRMEIDKVNK